MMADDSTLVDLIVPAYNEEDNLTRTVEETVSTLSKGNRDWDFRITLVVNDDSSDDTPAIADTLAEEYPQVAVIHRTVNPGFGNAIKHGFKESPGEILVPFMADLSDDPTDIPALVAAIENGYDIAYGSRFVDGGSVEGYPPLKRLYNRVFNNFIRLLYGIRARDVTNAFTAYHRDVITEIDVDTLESGSFDITAELPLRAHILGFESTEVPVSWRSREAGVSKLNATRKGPVYGIRVLKLFVMGNVLGLRDIYRATAKGSTRRVVPAAVLGLIILVSLFSFSGFGNTFDIIARTNWPWLLVAAGAYVGSFLFRTWRYSVLLRTAGHRVAPGAVFRSIMLGWFVNFLVPARAGDAVRGIALKSTENVPFSVATGLVVVERIADMAVLGGTMLIVAWILGSSSRIGLLAVGAFAISATLVGGLVVLYTFDDRIVGFLESRVPSIESGITALKNALEQIVRNPAAMPLVMLLSLPVWILEASTLYVSSRAVGLEMSVVPVVTAAVAAFVSQAVPITPAGIGTYEATITATLMLFDVQADVSTAFSLVDHFVRAIVVYVVGAVSAVHIGFRSRAHFRQRRLDSVTGPTSETKSKN
jgi:uncharacterized protein (TIRG00374 family)